MKKLSIALVLVAVFVGGITSSRYLGQANAQERGERQYPSHLFKNHDKSTFTYEGKTMHKWGMKNYEGMGGNYEKFMTDVNKEVTLIENGVSITMTSDNPETVKKLQMMTEMTKGSWGSKWRHGNQSAEVEMKK